MVTSQFSMSLHIVKQMLMPTSGNRGAAAWHGVLEQARLYLLAEKSAVPSVWCFILETKGRHCSPWLCTVIRYGHSRKTGSQAPIWSSNTTLGIVLWGPRNTQQKHHPHLPCYWSTVRNSQYLEVIWVPPKDDQLQKLWCIHTIEYYAGVRKNEVMKFVCTWMNMASSCWTKWIRGEGQT